MSEFPTVSAIIPVYNGARYLAQAVESVRQQQVPVEIIIVDDASTDETPALCASLGEDVRVIRHPTNRGAAASRNTGVDAAHGSLIAFLDSDDLWLENKLRIQMDCLAQHPEIQFTLTYVEFFLEPGKTLPASYRAEWLEGPQPGYLLSAFVGRRALFDVVGKFNATFVQADDVDWFARARDFGVPMMHMDEVLLRKRVHDTNLTKDVKSSDKDLMTALKNSLDRKRGITKP